MKDLQTPQKDQSRPLKPKDSCSSSSKKPQKVAKKSLNGALTSVAGDSLPDITSDLFQVAKKSLNCAFTSEDSLPAITSDSSQVAKKSLDGAFTSSSEYSLSVITTDSSQASTAVFDLAIPNPTVSSDSIQGPGRPAESVYAVENLVRQVRSRKVLEEMIKVAVAEHLAVPPPVSSRTEGIDRLLNSKLSVTLITFFVWCLVVSVAVPFGLGYPAGPSPT